MDQRKQGGVLPPHVLIFPLPLQGHVNSMLQLAELLCLAGLHVTFLVSDYTHDRLHRHSDIPSRFATYPGFLLQSIPDGIPAESTRSGHHHLPELIDSLKFIVKPHFRELVVSSKGLRSEIRRPLTCIITDAIMSFAIDIADEVGIPIIYFRTSSACSCWTYFCIPELIEAGELPLTEDLDLLIKNVPGTEGFLRRRDLPSFCRLGDLNDRVLQFVSSETRQSTRARALILNSFEDLEGPMLSQIRTRIPNLHPIGPLHSQLKARLGTETTSPATSSSSLREVDRSCMTWLDSQSSKSVIYVSFGSLATLTKEQLMEFWHGLVNSGQPFLWVIRADLVGGKDWEGEIPAEVVEGTKARGYMVDWAPQEEVLAHWAVGGFLTHSGWNSTLESIEAGVPMLCWPFFADQQTNSRFVGEVWKLGLDMKDTCDRVTVEKMVKDLMEVRKDEFTKSADRMAKLTRQVVSEGGSSYCHLNRLIEDIRCICVESLDHTC